MSEHELPHEIEEDSLELNRDKRVALLIGVLAVLLALTEMLGQKAQMSALQHNIEAANQWAFFQAKAERETTYAVAIEAFSAVLPAIPENARAAAQQSIDKWHATSAKLHDDPERRTGTLQLHQRAKEAEELRNKAERKHSRYELASAALHIGIVLASASIITGMASFVTAALSLAGISAILTLAGLLI